MVLPRFICISHQLQQCLCDLAWGLLAVEGQGDSNQITQESDHLTLLWFLQGIVLFHHSIRGALEVFASEAAALHEQAGVTASQLAGLVERHRFLRSVCMFHSLSEEEVSVG